LANRLCIPQDTVDAVRRRQQEQEAGQYSFQAAGDEEGPPEGVDEPVGPRPPTSPAEEAQQDGEAEQTQAPPVANGVA
jgi:hypothetical protein